MGQPQPASFYLIFDIFNVHRTRNHGKEGSDDSTALRYLFNVYFYNLTSVLKVHLLLGILTLNRWILGTHKLQVVEIYLMHLFQLQKYR